MTLYREHRPTHFSDVIGQQTAVRILEQALRKQRVAHAYLFSGPRGTGKTSTARIFARALVCEHPLTKGEHFEPCDTCASCLAILNGSTPDLIEIDAASNRGIEDIRSLREQVQYRPNQLSYKLYIIDEVHMLTTEAFNALLKTLEEPPAHCNFILATTDIHKLPATVRSRCQLVRFAPAKTSDIVSKLEKIIAHNQLTVDVDALKLIAAAAEGGFRDAETILEQLTTQHDTLSGALTRETLGTLSEESCQNLVEAVLSQNLSQVNTCLQRDFSDTATRYSWVIGHLIEIVHALPPSAVTIRFLEALLEASILQKHSPVPQLPLALACYSACQQQEDFKPVNRPVLNTSLPKVKVTPKVVPAPQTVPVVELHAKREPIPDVRKAWKELADIIAGESAPLGQVLKQVSIHRAEEELLELHVRYKFHLEKLSEKQNLYRVQDLLAELTGHQWKLRYTLNSNLPKHEPKRQVADGGLSTEHVNAVFNPAPNPS